MTPRPQRLSSTRRSSDGLPTLPRRHLTVASLAPPHPEPCWAIYVRRSYTDEDDADVSEAVQEAVARSRLPRGAEVIVLRHEAARGGPGTAWR